MSTSDKAYRQSIKSVGKMTADRAMKKWGAGWERLSRDQQQAAIAMECLMGIFSSVDPNVEVQIARDIFKAAMQASGAEDQSE